MFSLVSLFLFLLYLEGTWAFIQKKISSNSDSTYPMGFSWRPLPFFHNSPSPILSSLYLPPFAFFSHHHNLSCFSPFLCTQMVKNQQYRVRVFFYVPLHPSLFFLLCGYVVTEFGHSLENTTVALQLSLNNLHDPHCCQNIAYQFVAIANGTDD